MGKSAPKRIGDRPRVRPANTALGIGRVLLHTATKSRRYGTHKQHTTRQGCVSRSVKHHRPQFSMPVSVYAVCRRRSTIYGYHVVGELTG